MSRMHPPASVEFDPAWGYTRREWIIPLTFYRNRTKALMQVKEICDGQFFGAAPRPPVTILLASGVALAPRAGTGR